MASYKTPKFPMEFVFSTLVAYIKLKDLQVSWVSRHAQRPVYAIQAHTHKTVDQERLGWWFPIFYTMFFFVHIEMGGTFTPRTTHICGVNTHWSSMILTNFHGLHATSGSMLDCKHLKLFETHGTYRPTYTYSYILHPSLFRINLDSFHSPVIRSALHRSALGDSWRDPPNIFFPRHQHFTSWFRSCLCLCNLLKKQGMKLPKSAFCIVRQWFHCL